MGMNLFKGVGETLAMAILVVGTLGLAQLAIVPLVARAKGRSAGVWLILTGIWMALGAGLLDYFRITSMFPKAALLLMLFVFMCALVVFLPLIVIAAASSRAREPPGRIRRDRQAAAARIRSANRRRSRDH